MPISAPCRSELARDGLKSDALVQKQRVIVNVHREQARSYKVGIRTFAGFFWTITVPAAWLPTLEL